MKERKIRKKIRDDDIKGILDSVIAAVSNSSLNIDEEERKEFAEINDTETDHLKEDDKRNEFLIAKDYNENIPDYSPDCEPVYAKTDPNREKVSNHEAMKENNARMDNMWDNILNSSTLSLHKIPANNK